MNATLTLFIYWSIALGLIAGGLYTLNRGFKLILSGQGRTKEQNTVEILGLKATLGSIGALVMVTAFLWGWAASRALPNYADRDTTVTGLRTELEQKKQTLAKRDRDIKEKETQLARAVGEVETAWTALGGPQATCAKSLDHPISLEGLVKKRLDEAELSKLAVTKLETTIKERDAEFARKMAQVDRSLEEQDHLAGSTMAAVMAKDLVKIKEGAAALRTSIEGVRSLIKKGIK